MKSNLNTLINQRDKLSKDMHHYWSIIISENKMDKSATRNYDLKVLLSKIEDMANKRVLTKLRIQCANMGIKAKDLPTNANIINVYKLSELTEQYVQLGLIKTINPIIKAKKGKKNIKQSEVFTSSWIKTKKEKLLLQINAIKKEMTTFNETEVEEDEFLFQLV